MTMAIIQIKNIEQLSYVMANRPNRQDNNNS